MSKQKINNDGSNTHSSQRNLKDNQSQTNSNQQPPNNEPNSPDTPNTIQSSPNPPIQNQISNTHSAGSSLQIMTAYNTPMSQDQEQNTPLSIIGGTPHNNNNNNNNNNNPFAIFDNNINGNNDIHNTLRNTHSIQPVSPQKNNLLIIRHTQSANICHSTDQLLNNDNNDNNAAKNKKKFQPPLKLEALFTIQNSNFVDKLKKGSDRLKLKSLVSILKNPNLDNNNNNNHNNTDNDLSGRPGTISSLVFYDRAQFPNGDTIVLSRLVRVTIGVGDRENHVFHEINFHDRNNLPNGVDSNYIRDLCAKHSDINNDELLSKKNDDNNNNDNSGDIKILDRNNPNNNNVFANSLGIINEEEDEEEDEKDDYKEVDLNHNSIDININTNIDTNTIVERVEPHTPLLNIDNAENLENEEDHNNNEVINNDDALKDNDNNDIIGAMSKATSPSSPSSCCSCIIL